MINEQEIIAACQNGQLERFGELYDAYIKKIYEFIYFKTTHKETAEDLTSQTFFKALEKINLFSFEKGSFAAWLYQIARNTVIDHYRTKKDASDIEDIWDLDDKSDIARDLDAKDKLEKVEKYLATLKQEQREIIIMRVWQEMSYQEIADALGKSESSCKMMFSRAITTLRNEMPISLLIYFMLLKLN